MGVFTRNYIKSQYSGSDGEFYASRELFDGLEALHKLWFQINELEKRFSGRAEDKKENLRADFYVLSEKLINAIMQIYSNWAEGHSKDGWWLRSGLPELEMGEGRIDRGERGTVDITPIIKQEVEKYINRDINWFDEFWNTEHDYKAAEFLAANINNVKKFNQPHYKDEVEEAINLGDDRLARLVIDKVGLIDDYYDWSVNKGYFSKHFDLGDNYGDDWWDVVFGPDSHYGFDLELILENPAIKEEAWKQWLKLWPNYEATLIQVEQIINKLNSVRGTANINEIMITISIALNVAHNSGLMYEHLGLNEGDMEDLSNLSTRDWSNEIKQYSKKIVALYNRATYNQILIRITDSNGRGLMNNQALDRSKLSDDEENELMELMDFGLQQPRNVPNNVTFFFTEEGYNRHKRLIDLLKKASINGYKEQRIQYSGVPLWQSTDGQVAVVL